ncbi:hypothetical protein Asp14428_28100 [Actinoplanes sp. NBRC 14428]|uniref:DUF6314 domain-containing protein n=1 Tax=Pseudosporangium ferrugineum TaxID=439699 RepID=A0A2T0R935_9ACTN|nr:DUF6314 family protein [Pseudosporangium ferrugineum]PRY17682.1 hypothetical protein CLV70_1508 [Pseudosporangium ferrugineum]BCJ51335.1 hypothetical protein Asp14428_28100 [Actinoplanes sp. NBRC 14428]
MHVTPAAFLEGEWTVRRVILDHRAGAEGSFTGRARFTREPGGTLRYAEEGEVSIGEHRGPATRELTYQQCDDGTVDVRFADGRAFYRLDLDGDRWHATHPCDPDHYTVTGRITGPDGFTEHWHAVGPRKDYELATTYARVTAGPPPSA